MSILESHFQAAESAKFPTGRDNFVGSTVFYNPPGLVNFLPFLLHPAGQREFLSGIQTLVEPFYASLYAALISRKNDYFKDAPGQNSC